MAGKILKASIRFNDDDLKYMSFTFDQNSSSCTVDAVMIIEGNEVKVRGAILPAQWVPVEDKEAKSDPLLSVNPVRSTKTTAKKAVKESK